MKRLILLVTALMLWSTTALALDFRSVAVTKATLYDAPSSVAKKVLLLSKQYPVEVMVNLGDWLKVRDAEGGLNWVEAKALSSKRTVLVCTANAEIRQAADANSKVLANVEKEVVLEVLDAKPTNGWVKVKHRDGLIGYIMLASTWGAE